MRLAALCVLATQLAAFTAVSAGSTGIVTGKILPGPASRPAATTVWIGALPTPVAADGSFRAAGVPAGLAHLAIETPAGVYVVASPVSVAPGATQSLQLAIAGGEDTSPAPAAETEKKKKKSGIWANPASATLIIIGSAIIVGVVIDQLVKSETVPVSPSSPTH